MMLTKNKKGFVGDVMTGMAMLFALFVVLGICIFIIVQWNDAVQNSSAFPIEAKTEQQAFTDTYPTMMGWILPAALIGLFVYTLITAYLVEVISKVWFIIGLVVAVFQAVVSGIFQFQVFPAFAGNAVYASTLQYMPGAAFYFGNAVLVNSVWAFLILLALYFKREA